MAGLAAQAATSTGIDLSPLRIHCQSITLMHRWPVEWMSSEAAGQHASIKLSRLAGIETSSKLNSRQPASASFVIFVASMLNSVCREHHILTELYLAG